MNKLGTRTQLSIDFLIELRNIMNKDSELEVVMAEIQLVENPDYSKAGKFKINTLIKK